jgi:uncharacterized protein (TIGR02271 family)
MLHRQNVLQHEKERHMTEHIVAVFESNASATAAAQGLADIGIPVSAIRQYVDKGTTNPQDDHATSTSTTHTSGGGFWSWLFGEDSTTKTTHSGYGDDIGVYDRRAEAGDFILSVTVTDDTKIHQAISLLEAHDPIDIDERTEGEPTTSGAPMAASTGPSITGRDFSSGDVASAGAVDATTPGGRVGEAGASAGAAATPVAGGPIPPAPDARAANLISPTAPGATREEVIPLSEEKLEIGKRTVDRGTTRIRRYVVNKPVEETLTLHGQRVTVEKRTPIETATPGAGSFEERVVEVSEPTEEPVVAKTARVVEEVVVGREATERTETVKDTVRREEVEISGDGKLGGVGP